MAPDHATSLLLLFLFFHVPCNHMFTNKCIMGMFCNPHFPYCIFIGWLYITVFLDTCER